MTMETTAPAPAATPLQLPREATSPSPHAPPPARVKPLLRGVSHQVSFFIAIVATALLVARTGSSAARLAALVFGGTLVSLFGISACYHRIDWSTVGRQRMRRLDHAAIFLLIAGGYTPLFYLVPAPGGGHGALVAIWIAGAVGVAKSLAWPSAPKWLLALLCLGMGWMCVSPVMARAGALSSTCLWLLVASGVTYSAGAVVYALKRPDPAPRVFGYHEIFHLLVVAASAMLFAHVTLVLRVGQG